MKVITMESSAYKEMMAQIANIAGYIREARDEKKRKRETEDKLLDTAQAAKMLNVSKRTMQRMRTLPYRNLMIWGSLSMLQRQGLPRIFRVLHRHRKASLIIFRRILHYALNHRGQ